ncbi:MAG: hypothetical protein CMJ83_18570 [Planctomycetes bacterium]|nr:hypothetical protein [Planctomycetota bacterium]
MAGAIPTDAQLVHDGLLSISWSDGDTLHYPLDHLRARCPCAHCAPKHGDVKPPLTADEFRGVGLKSLEETGTYAMQIGFTDGHSLGIYTHDHLLAIGFPEGEAPVATTPRSFDV